MVRGAGVQNMTWCFQPLCFISVTDCMHCPLHGSDGPVVQQKWTGSQANHVNTLSSHLEHRGNYISFTSASKTKQNTTQHGKYIVYMYYAKSCLAQWSPGPLEWYRQKRLYRHKSCTKSAVLPSSRHKSTRTVVSASRCGIVGR